MMNVLCDARKRVIYIDVLRIIAILGVILIHACAALGNGFTHATDLVLDSLRVFTHFSINIFFMVSGAMILSKKYDWSKFYKTRLLRIIPALIILPLVSIPFGAFTGHLWFLHAILMFYTLSPIVKTWLDKADGKQIRGVLLTLLGLAMINKSLAFLTDPTWIFDNDFLSYFALYLWGWYLYGNKIKIKSSGKILALITILAIELLVVFLGWNNQFFTVNTSPLNIVGAIVVFLLVKDLQLNKLKPKMQLVLADAGKSVFGIYLIHMIVINLLIPPIYQYLPHIKYFAVNALYKILLLTITTFLTSWLIIYLVKKIPAIKKFM